MPVDKSVGTSSTRSGNGSEENNPSTRKQSTVSAGKIDKDFYKQASKRKDDFKKYVAK